MRRRLACAALAALLASGAAHAAPASKKRAPPDEVPPLVIGGTRYEAPHWGKARGLPQNGGYVVAVDAVSGRELFATRVYRLRYDRGREGDKQDVFITALSPSGDGAAILVENERGDRYRLDLATRRAVRLPP